MTAFRWIIRICVACVSITGAPAAASLGGPQLAEPLGWDPTSHEAYFAIHHYDESGYAATVVRLRLDGPDTTMCDALSWSMEVDADSIYQARLRTLTKKLSPLTESMWTTVPSDMQIVRADTFRTESGRPNLQYRVRGKFGGSGGWVEALTYVDPAVRMIRLYHVPEVGVSIGLFSFIGLAHEGGYEVQIPAVLPRSWGSNTFLRWVPEW